MERDTEDDDAFSLDHDDDVIDDHGGGGHGNNEDDDGILNSQQTKLSTTNTDSTVAAAGVVAPGDGSSPSPVVDEEEHMGTDPYNPDDWNKNKFDLATGEEEGEGEVGAGKDDPLQYLGFDDDISESGGSNESDVDSLMDHGLAEVDNILRMKGRFSVLDEPRKGQKATTTPDDPELDETLPQLELGREQPLPRLAEGGEALPQLEVWAGQQQGAGVKRLSAIESPVRSHSARGTGAQAATSLKSATAPSGSVNLASNPTGGTAPPTTTTSDGSGGSAYRVQNNNRGVAPPHATVSTIGGENKLHSLSPARRRRARKEPPFIQAKGVTLTYAQAKLFGLVGGGGGGGGNDGRHPSPPSVAQTSKIIRNATKSWPHTHSSREKNAADHDRRPRGRVQERRAQEGRQHRHTYSPSRMELLACPVPGRGRVLNTTDGVGVTRGGVLHVRGVGGRTEGDFTWKRSRKAEAAMRDPACGYDFVREGGQGKEEFLRRVEAYSSYSRAKIEAQRAEDIYAARLDKLECPRCQNPQSYDEFSTKKLKCPGCEVPYCMPKTWNRRIWDQRNQMCAAKSEERQARIERETEEAFLAGIPKQTRHALLLRKRVGQVDFIRRMRRDLRRRRAREENQTGPRSTTGAVDEYDRDQNGSRKTRPASAPVGSRARAVAAVAAAAAAAAPRLATAQKGAERLAPTTTPSSSDSAVGRREERTPSSATGKRGENSRLPVTLEARAVSSAEPPATRLNGNPSPSVNSNRDVVAAANPYGNTLPAKSNRDRLVAAVPFGAASTRGNSNRDGLVTRLASRSTSFSSAPRRPASAGAARTVVAMGATRTTNNNKSVFIGTAGAAVDGLRDS